MNQRFLKAVIGDLRDIAVKEGDADPIVFILTEDNIYQYECKYENLEEKRCCFAYLKKYRLPKISGLKGAVFASRNICDPLAYIFQGYTRPDNDSSLAFDALLFIYYEYGEGPYLRAYEIIKDDQGKVIDTSLKFVLENVQNDTILDDYFNPRTLH